MPKIVLTRPPLASKGESRWAQIAPLGLAYLASSVRAAGHEVAVLDGKLAGFSSTTEHARAIAALNPDYVGISAMTFDFCRAADLALQVKKLCAAKVVLGGAHVNALPERALSEAVAVDFVIAGEGEGPLVQLLAAGTDPALLARIPGLYARTDSGLTIKGLSPVYDTALENLPFPAWDLFPVMTSYPVMWTRGCPFHCVFCSANMSKQVRGRSVDRVVDEVAWLLETFSPRSISFQDETFGLDAAKAMTLLQSLRPLHVGKGVKFTAQTRVDVLTEPIARAMVAAGFEFMEFGVESGNPDVLARSGKGVTLSQVQDAVHMARKTGLKVWLKFILGLPGETKASVLDTVMFAARLRPHRVSISIIVAYPGSKIFRWAEEGRMGYRLLTRSWDKFDKYLSSSVELQDLPYRYLRKWQVIGYLAVYLRGFRVGELLRAAWLGRSLLVSLFKKKAPC